jgi:hypothetical protein
MMRMHQALPLSAASDEDGFVTEALLVAEGVAAEAEDTRVR